ncbi:MAG: bifunctional [glutamate--ammonia ligase]-adenylyl-L-tyrosine phosphorylase/[glutamate--ammonia-ligase] adenylyltransferase [Magnetococcales bacterium]|nr:bifunctional [glutamate--ammonia ligase]-adenylyl-L-tyrosine phosphorylase/[glutamate--ammonia-ligase] adenylyltransferase [Magnetococcales bacterium]
MQQFMSTEVASTSDLEWLAAATAEPDAVRHYLDSLLQGDGQRCHGLRQMLEQSLWRRRLVAVLGNSPYLAQVVLRWPHFLTEILAHEESGQLQSCPTIATRDELVAQILMADSWTAAATCLRLFKHRAYLRIGLLDLSGDMAVTDTIAALSDVADFTLEASYQWVYRDLCRQYGVPRVPVADGSYERVASRFVVLGMGKLGAGELNFSSDVDLIFLYDQDEGETDGPQQLSIKAFYTRLGRDLIKLMQEPTADGRVFRVDLRLRPDGDSGDLALSCRSAEIYYESWGQTWERAAMIKARPVAGDLALGEQFLKTLYPFVYRRYLDFAALDAIREMKRLIDRKVTKADDYYRNVKLGYGGIREIEFLVQSHQLIHGGRMDGLRQRGTLPVLQQLAHRGLLSQQSADQLQQAYLLLRKVEHCLQIVREQQTHSLPDDEGELERLARRVGMASADRLRQQLQQATDQVHQAYSQLFFESERAQQQEQQDPVVERLLLCDPDSEGDLALLRQMGIENGAAVGALLALLRDGPKGVNLTEAARRHYQRLAPVLLSRIIRAPDPDQAVQHAEAFLNRIGRRTNYIALLAENPPVLDLIVPVFGSSPYLSRYLNSHLELLDSLITREFLQHSMQRSVLAAELAQRLAQVAIPEQCDQVLHEFKSGEILRIGLRDLSGMTDLTEVMVNLATVATVIVTQTLHDARTALESRYGVPGWTDEQGQRHRAQFVILAMGKLGGQELNYASDLDLIFVYDSQGEEQWCDGNHGFSNQTFFNRLGQHVIQGITRWTQSGRLYELDMRLRPSGNSGPLVISLAAFVHYQHHEAWTWEHQALTRAHVVAGDADLAGRLRHEIRSILCQPRDPVRLRQDVIDMRERMVRDKPLPAGVLDIKQSRGAIVDLEFMVQYLILRHAADHPAIAQRNLSTALLAMSQFKLLADDTARMLHDHYQFYRLIENRLRLLHDRSENRISTHPWIQMRLVRLCGLDEQTDLMAHLQQRFDAVSAVWHQLLQVEAVTA